MTRRSGQNGYICKKGDFYIVRFREDVAGQIDRVYRSERICPISGPGKLTKPERERRAKDIINQRGVDTAEHLQRAQETSLSTMFRQQSEKYVLEMEHRRNKPVKPRTIVSVRSALRWINGRIGDMALSDVDNGPLADLINQMCEPRSATKPPFSPKSIRNYTLIVMQVVASARNPKTGKRLYPRDWDEFVLDRPAVTNQRTPTFTAEEIQQIISRATPQLAVLYVLLAATGLRINEALALKVGDFCDGTLTIDRAVWHGNETTPKTRFAYRKVDLAPDVSQILAAFLVGRKDGYIFRARNGSPFGDRNLLRDSLHPILEKMGLDRRGFHSFRRYRCTWLRKNRTPEDLTRYWLGHGDKSVTDRYSKLSEDDNFRQLVASEVGTGLSGKIFTEIQMLHPAAPLDPRLQNFSQTVVN